MDDFYRRLFAGGILPAYHALKRDGFNAAFRETRRAEAMDATAFRDLGRRKLAAMLRHAIADVPYYREVLPPEAPAQVEGGASLLEAGVPDLTKEIIRERFDDLVSLSLPAARRIPNSTSGSTGEPTRFYTDIVAAIRRSTIDLTNKGWLGCRVGDREAALWGSQIDQRVASSLRGRLHSLVTRRLMLDAYDLSESRMDRYARQLAEYRPKLLTGYPSVLVRFGEWCVANGRRIDGLLAIICSAEALFDDQREAIASYFGATVINRYGCREFGCIAHERPGVDGMVINGDRVAVEIASKADAPVPVGDVGELLITDLDNFVMPLIRYRIGDLAAVDPAAEATGERPRLARVEGRSLDVVTTPDGRAVGGTFWTILLRSRPGLLQFQVIQTAPDRLSIRYVRDPAVAEPDLTYFRAGIARNCGNEMVVTFEAVAEIGPEPNGKYRLVKVLSDGQNPVGTGR